MVIGYPPLFHPNFQAILTHKRGLFKKKRAQRCLEAAREAGLKIVRIGNLHLLG
jgi:hypothetical protein